MTYNHVKVELPATKHDMECDRRFSSIHSNYRII